MVAFSAELTDSNADKRFIKYVQHLTARLPETVPDQIMVFELGHATDRLAGYAANFADETSSVFLVEQYKGLVELLRQVTAQFPAWREFKRNALSDELTHEQVDTGFALAAELALAMDTVEAREFIDPALPKAIRELIPNQDQQPALSNSGRDLQAADAVASSENTLRSLVLASFAKANEITHALGRGSVKGVEKISENVMVFTANLAYWGAIAELITLFPQLAWIAPLAMAMSKTGKS